MYERVEVRKTGNSSGYSMLRAEGILVPPSYVPAGAIAVMKPYEQGRPNEAQTADAVGSSI